MFKGQVGDADAKCFGDFFPIGNGEEGLLVLVNLTKFEMAGATVVFITNVTGYGRMEGVVCIKQSKTVAAIRCFLNDKIYVRTVARGLPNQALEIHLIPN